MAITFVKKPTSPLHFEPIDTLPEDILCPGSDQEDEDDEDKRAKKKLRIELLAKQYLEGRGLFIQSAALRGPFEGQWVNPWRSKKRKHGEYDNQRSSRELNAEEGPCRHTEPGTGYPTVKGKSVRENGLDSLAYDHEERVSMGRGLTQEGNHTAKRRRRVPLQEPIGHDELETPVTVKSPPYTTKQEPWLKTNKPYLQRNVGNDRKSPTPTPFPRDIAQTPRTPPQRARSQSGDDLASTNSNEPLQFQHRRNAPAGTSIIRSDLQHNKTATGNYAYIREKKRDLSAVDEAMEGNYEDVNRLSREIMGPTDLKREEHQSNLSQIEAPSAEPTTSRQPGRLEPYVSAFAIADPKRDTAGLGVSSRPLQALPHVVPPSTYVPEFQYRYAGNVRSRDFTGDEGNNSRSRRASSSSSGSDSCAEPLADAQAKADSMSIPSSHSSSPTAEAHETTSVKKNTSAMRRLTFSPLGSIKVAPWQSSSRPSSNCTPTEPHASVMNELEDRRKSSRENLLIRKASSRSSDLPTSNGNRSRNSVIFPEAQVAAGALLPSSQRPSGSSTNLLETERPLPNYPSLDEGDSYANLSTQAAFVKAQRSFKDDVLSAFRDLPAKTMEKISGALRPATSDLIPTADSGQPEDTKSPWGTANWQDNDDDEPVSTQAMVDQMSPFIMTTVKKCPPALNKRTSFARTPTRQKPPVPTTIRAPGPLLKISASCQRYAKNQSNEQIGRVSATATKTRSRHVACAQCRKQKRRCTHNAIDNETSLDVAEQLIQPPNTRTDSRKLRDIGFPSQGLAQSSQPIREARNTDEHTDRMVQDDHKLESSAATPFRHSLSMSTSPSQHPPKLSPPIPLSHQNTTSKPTSSRTSFSILPDGTSNNTSIYQDGQQQRPNWNTSLPLDHFGLSPEEPARTGRPPSADTLAAPQSNTPATTARLNAADSQDLSTAIDDATSFLGTWNVETEARKAGQWSRDRDSTVKGILSVDE